jgi:hypothetical protein
MNMQNCSNLSQQISMANACTAMQSCTGFMACLNAIPGCPGTGGTNGGGGTTGSGGTSGGGDCTTCANAHACCLATDTQFGIADGAGCEAFTADQCNSMSGSAQTSYIATCTNELSAGAILGVTGCN